VTVYTIGDDVIGQNVNSTSQYLLYDGHGSTRQLCDNTGSLITGQSFDYDAYGIAVGFNTSTAATNLLYSGEQYDNDLSQYYLRARYYNQSNGRFNRMDPYHGNNSDPQSLHKYTYCHNNPINGINPSGLMTLISVTSTMANIGRAIIHYYPILKVGLIVADILTAANIVLKAITSGISSVTVGEWTRLALITATAFFGGKVARSVAKRLIRRALKIPAGILRSFKSFGNFVRSKGIFLEIDDLIVYNKDGAQVLGKFKFIGEGLNIKPMIVLHKGGHTISTLVHEYVHYYQWKHFVGGLSRADWQNFSSIGNYKECLENVAYFVADVFFK
jgi:RHS repeat-associated protein